MGLDISLSYSFEPRTTQVAFQLIALKDRKDKIIDPRSVTQLHSPMSISIFTIPNSANILSLGFLADSW